LVKEKILVRIVPQGQKHVNFIL